MTEMFLDASLRHQKGKGPARKLRGRGLVPAVVYGLHPPVSIQVGDKQAARLVQQLHGSERMISLRLGGGDGDGEKNAERHVLLKEVQTHPVSHQLLHVDFLEVEISKTVQVAVELKPVGTAEGVRLGGVLQAVKHDVLIECLPLEIPEFIEVDVSALEIGDSLHVKDLVFLEGVIPVTDSEETLIVISAPRVEEVEEVEEVPEGEEEGVAPEEAAEGEEAPEQESEQE